MRVPLIDLGAQYRAHKDEIDGAVGRVLASGRYVLGEEVEALERALAREVGRQHGIGVSSGSDALLLSLWALGVGPGAEVITTSFSFFATVGAIVRLGATPIFVDVDPITLHLELGAVRRAITAKTRAIVAVPLFGRPLPLEALRDLSIPIVIDGAQAIGCPHLGAPSIATTLSFFPTKNLGAVGDGGMILVDDPALAERMRTMRQHGSKPKYVHHELGGNFRLDPLQAAIVATKLPYLKLWNDKRRQNAARYRELLADAPLTLPADEPGHTYHHFVVRSPDRDRLRAHLSSLQVDSEVYYPLPLHQQPCFAHLPKVTLPNAERAAKEVLALPVHPDLDDAQLAFVAASIRSFDG